MNLAPTTSRPRQRPDPTGAIVAAIAVVDLRIPLIGLLLLVVGTLLLIL
jgi:hypothetical protein